MQVTVSQTRGVRLKRRHGEEPERARLDMRIAELSATTRIEDLDGQVKEKLCGGWLRFLLLVVGTSYPRAASLSPHEWVRC